MRLQPQTFVYCAALILWSAITAATQAADKAAESEGALTVGAATPAHSGAKVTASGTVIDESGKPMPGVKVYLREWSTYRISEDPYNRNPRDAFASCVTDDQGQYRFQDVASPAFHKFLSEPSRWDVIAIAEGHAMAWKHLPTANCEQPLSLTLGAESILSGRVVDENKRPITGVRIRVGNIDPLDAEIFSNRDDPQHLDLQQSELSPMASSDANGRFLIHNLPPNSRILFTIEHEEFERAFEYAATTTESQPDLEQPRVSADGKRATIMHKVHTGDFDLVLKPDWRIDGRIVLDDSNKPCPQAQVSLTWDSRWSYTTADENGRFMFSGQPDAKFKLSAIPADSESHIAGNAEVSFAAGHRKADVTVRLPRGVTVRGMVIAEDTKKGVPGVTVRYAARSSTNRADGMTSPDGSFRLLIPPGHGTVTILGPVPDYYIPNKSLVNLRAPELREEIIPRYRREVEVKDGQPLEDLRFIVGRGIVINGLAKDPEGKPIAGADVKRPGGMAGRIKDRTTRTGDDGRFKLAGFPANAEQRLEIVDNARRLKATTVVKPETPDQMEINFEIQLKQTATVAGRVEADGKPLSGVKARLFMHDTERGKRIGRPVADVVTDADGRYKFDLVEPEREYYVHIYRTRDDFETTRTIVPVAASARELPLVEFEQLGTSVSGVVVDPDGNPVESVSVSASDRRTGKQFNVQFRKHHGSITTDKQGRFTLRYLAKVPLRLMAYIPPQGGGGAIRFPAYVDAEPGQTNVRIVLDPKLVGR